MSKASRYRGKKQVSFEMPKRPSTLYYFLLVIAYSILKTPYQIWENSKLANLSIERYLELRWLSSSVLYRVLDSYILVEMVVSVFVLIAIYLGLRWGRTALILRDGFAVVFFFLFHLLAILLEGEGFDFFTNSFFEEGGWATILTFAASLVYFSLPEVVEFFGVEEGDPFLIKRIARSNIK